MCCWSQLEIESLSIIIVVKETSITVVVSKAIDFFICFVVLILLLESTFFCWSYLGGVWSLKLWSPWFRVLRHSHFRRFNVLISRYFAGSLFDKVIEVLLLFFLDIELTSTHGAHRIWEVASNFVQHIVIIDWISSPLLHVRSWVFTLVSRWVFLSFSPQLLNSVMALLVSRSSLPNFWTVPNVS